MTRLSILTGGLLLAMSLQAHAQSRVVTLAGLCLHDSDDCRNLGYVLRRSEQALARGGVDLLVIPYTRFLAFAQEAAAEDLKPFSDLARAHSAYLCIALHEGAGEQTYATSVLLDRSGDIGFTWRKTHALADDDHLALGDSLEVYHADFGTIAATIGTDFYFPEVYETLRMKGAEVILWQHYPERFREHSTWEPLLAARAFDSHCHLVTAMYADPRAYITNRYSMGMQGAAFGRSMVINRVGVPIADTGYAEGVALATVDLDRRKQDPYDPWVQSENVFFVNCVGDRTALVPVAEPWTPAVPGPHSKRTARLAVVYLNPENSWRNGEVPRRLLELLAQAADLRPDIILASEMSANEQDETTQEVLGQIAEKARELNAYICIGGLGDAEHSSIARVWDRQGNQIYGQPLYWVKGFPEIKVFDTDFARVGCHSCGDLYTPMFDRVLALKGAELILDPSQMWGGSGRINETLLRARAIDNGVWLACAHWNSSDPGLRSVAIDPYGQVMAASRFQQEGIFSVDIDFDDKRVYYAGEAPDQPVPGTEGIGTYISGDLPKQLPGWREMIFGRRHPELYTIIPTVNEVTMQYRPHEGQ